eukprot:3310938-Pyramimonas_sp.AAC.1
MDWSTRADDDDGVSDNDDDGASSVRSSGSGSAAVSAARANRTSRGGKNPTYWIEKLKVLHALLGTTDKRDVHHASECAAKFKLKFPNDDTAPKLQKHLIRIGVLLKISPAEVPSTAWPDIRKAYLEMCVIEHPPLGVGLLALVGKRATELATASTSGMSIRETDIKDLAACVTPWRTEGAATADEPAMFDALRPQIHPIAPILTGAVQAHTMAKFLVQKFVCPIISSTNNENISSHMSAVRTLTTLLDLPDDVDVHHEVMSLCDSLYLSFRAFEAVLCVGITTDTRFDYLCDVEALYKASEKTTGKSVLQDIGCAVNRNEFLGSRLSRMIQNIDIIRDKGTAVQRLVVRLTALDDTAEIEELTSTMTEALNYFK